MPSPWAPFLPLLAVLGCGAPPPAAAGDPAGSGPRTVVLVSLDTTRADALGGPFGSTSGATPNLDAFAAEAVVFTDALAAGNLTSMSHAALFTSRYPSEVGRVSGDFHLDGRVTTLPELFALYGWQTAAFTSGGHLTRQFGLDRGFDWYEYTSFQGSFWHTVPAAAHWLDERRTSEPALLFVHGYDAHTPYMAPAPFGRTWADPGYAAGLPGDHAVSQRLGTELIYGPHLFRAESMLGFLVVRDQPRHWDAAARAATAEEARRVAASSPGQVEDFGEADHAYVRGIYAGAVAYEDAMFGELVRILKARGLYESATIVVFGDHGEQLGEDGRYGHGEDLVATELHVPLMIRHPGSAPRVVDAPVSLVDVLPTLCELQSLTPPADARGASLAPWLRGESGPVRPWRFADGNLAQAAVFGPEGSLVFEGVDAQSPYHQAVLATAALDGPAFRGTGAAADPAGRAPYRDALAAWRSGITTLLDAAPASPEAVEEMKKNGYFTP